MAKKEPNDKSHEKDQELLKRLKDNLDQIEIDEIMKGMTKKELEDMGFVGDKEINIDRTVFTETTEREKLSFKEGIEFERLPDHTQFESLDIDSLMLIKDVMSGTVIATREPDETIPFNAGNNVKKEESERGEKYTAELKGKVVIIKDTMHIFPSDIDCNIEVRIAHDKMTVNMDCEAGYGDGKHLTTEVVMEEINKQGIVHGIQMGNIKKAIADAEKLSVPQKNIVIAEGTPHISGMDSAIEYHFNKEEEKQTFKILPDGRIDYKGSANITIAKKGELLAEIKGAGTGINGVDVVGEVLLADKGKQAHLVAGNGVKVSDDGQSFYADIKGCVVLNYPVLEVLELYEVQGDVDYSTGSIDFSGNVIINGTVHEGFEVKADGDIIIQNCVESARIIAGRDVRISGGILGHGKGVISAGRDVYAEYAQNGKIEAQGTVYLNDFAVNSTISCNYLNMLKKHGSVVGGEIIAQRGIDIINLGSQSGTKTYVSAGTDFLVRTKIKELDDAIKFFNENLKKIDNTLKPILKRMKSDPNNQKYNNALVKSTIDKRKELASTLRIMEAKKKHLQEQLEIEGVCFVKVKHTCFGDVHITIKDLKFNNAYKRENVRFYEDRKEGEVKTGAY